MSEDPPPSSSATEFDVFISYARADNHPIPVEYPHGWVTAIRDHICKDWARYSSIPLRPFLDKEEINSADDWRNRILAALRKSKILLVCFSPNYFASQPCRWEWDEYLKGQVHRLMGSDSYTSIYFVTAPDSGEKEHAALKQWLDDVKRADYIDLRDWFQHGPKALQEEHVRAALAKLGGSIYQRIERARRAENALGNLDRHNPHFVGRRKELTDLHAKLAPGIVGVVTAVHGLGGQGKTALALAFAHLWADHFGGGRWNLRAEGKKELLPLIAELATVPKLRFTLTDDLKNDPVRCGLAVLDHLQHARHLKHEIAGAEAERKEEADRADPDSRFIEQLDRQLKTLREWLGRGTPSVFILLDNVSEDELLSPAQLATLPDCRESSWLRILATTRLDLTEQKDRLALIPIDSLDSESALDLIRDHQPYRDAHNDIVYDAAKAHPKEQRRFASAAEEAAAAEIVRDLGGFTLAVEQVAVYLGIETQITPSVFLQTLRAKGFATVIALGENKKVYDRIELDAHRKKTEGQRAKQLGLILDQTLSKLDAPALTAMQFAALLPPDTVPWPWLRALTEQVHPELKQKDALGADPWMSVERRLQGLRLLTDGDGPDMARIHRLVGHHVARATNQQIEERIDELIVGGAWHRAEAGSPATDWESEVLSSSLQLRMLSRSNTKWSKLIPEAAIDHALTLEQYGSLNSAKRLLECAVQEIEARRIDGPYTQHLTIVAFLRLGDVAMTLGDTTSAFRYYQDSRNDAQTGITRWPDSIELWRDFGVASDKLGDLALAAGHTDEAKQLFAASLAVHQELSTCDPTNDQWQNDYAGALGTQAMIAMRGLDLETALACWENCLHIRKALVAKNPDDAFYRKAVLIPLENLAVLSQTTGRSDDAKALFEALQVEWVTLFKHDPANLEYLHGLAIPTLKLGELAQARGDFGEATKYFGTASAVFESLLKKDPNRTTWLRDQSVSLEKLAEVAMSQADWGKASSHLHASKTLRERLLSLDSKNTVWKRDLSISMEKLADTIAYQGDFDQAMELHTKRKSIAAQLLEADPTNTELMRDLVAAHYKLAAMAGQVGWFDQMRTEALACLAQLNAMSDRQVPFDLQLTRIYESLQARFGSS